MSPLLNSNSAADIARLIVEPLCVIDHPGQPKSPLDPVNTVYE